MTHPTRPQPALELHLGRTLHIRIHRIPHWLLHIATNTATAATTWHLTH